MATTIRTEQIEQTFEISLIPSSWFRNGWDNYNNSNGSYGQAKFSKSGTGTVTLQGLIKGSNSGTILQLPPELRPTKTLIFACQTQNGPNRVDVKPNGDITTTNSGWVSLSNISFDTN